MRVDRLRPPVPQSTAALQPVFDNCQSGSGCRVRLWCSFRHHLDRKEAMGVTKTLRDMDVELEEGEESKKSMEAGVGLMMKKMMLMV